MTAAESAEEAVEYAAPWIERLARIGYAAKGVLYATIGFLAAHMPFGEGALATTNGAMHSVQHAPFGRFLIAVIAIGLIGYAIWRMVEAWLDPERRGNGAKGLALRASFAFRAIIHAALAVTAVRLAVGSPVEGDGNDAERWAARALGITGGRWVLWIIALSIGAFGLYQIYRAFAAKLSKQLELGRISREVGYWIIGVSRLGIAARGIVFSVIAFLLGTAALRKTPASAGGVDDALQSLARLGSWPFTAIAFGLVAYGLYELLNARYRRIRVT